MSKYEIDHKAYITKSTTNTAEKKVDKSEIRYDNVLHKLIAYNGCIAFTLRKILDRK